MIGVIPMDSIYRDALPDVFATCDFDPESLKIPLPEIDEDEDDVETV